MGVVLWKWECCKRRVNGKCSVNDDRVNRNGNGCAVNGYAVNVTRIVNDDVCFLSVSL